ncbi:gliding motility protein GldB-related protein [Aquirufa nivalisilvae]|uniref:gliding motility protein GldB-related protein n=1 Tax=Aquirufa nivalisilvae TaxID=2516557 RepID=UPI001032AB81|nr:gliding motility protein [Aquirufa nivalisilvae]TBH71086.1 gliding motility protein [Aquirufa nivalisilvae]
MKITKRYVGFFWLMIAPMILGSCGSTEDKKEIKEKVSTIQLDIQRLDQAIANSKNEQQIDSILLKHPEVLHAYFSVGANRSKELAKNLFALFQNPALRKFYEQSQQDVFFGGQVLEKELQTAFQEIKNEFPQAKIPKIRTVFTGFGAIGNFKTEHLVVSDSLIIIGLDYFMGKKGMYLPQNVYDYQLRRLEPRALVGQILLLYSGYFNKHMAENATMLSDMIWYGKSYAFAKKMAPALADSLLFGYTQKELTESDMFQQEIWEHFIDQSLLYKQDEFTKAKYLGERPKTVEIGPACPGSIGRWLGWKIIDAYQTNHPQERLAEVMAKPDANQLFQASGYRGKAKE